MQFDSTDSYLLFACKKNLGVIPLRQEGGKLEQLSNWAGNKYSLLCLGVQPRVIIAGLQSGQVIAFKALESHQKQTSSDATTSAIGLAFETALMDQHKGPCGAIWTLKQSGGFLTAGFDGSVIQWDWQLNRVHKFELKAGSPFKISSLKIKSICEDPLTGVFIVANRAGDIFEVKLNDKTPPAPVNKLLMKGHMHTLTGLDVVTGRSEIVTLAKEGTLVVRDVDKKTHKLVLPLEFEGSVVTSHQNGHHVAVGYTNGALQIVDINNTATLLSILDQKSRIVILKYAFNRTNYLLASAAEDGQIIFYREDDKYSRYLSIQTVQPPPLSLDFCDTAETDSTIHKTASSVLQVVSMNFLVTYYDFDELTKPQDGMLEEKPKPEPSFRKVVKQQRNQTWQTWTSACGWHVLGLLKDPTIVSRLSCLQRSPDKNFVAVGLLDGSLRVYKFPCVREHSGFVEYKSHSGPISAIVFMPGKNLFFTIGRDDHAVVHWSYEITEDFSCTKIRESESEPARTIKLDGELGKSQGDTPSIATERHKQALPIVDEQYANLSPRLAEAPDQNLELRHVFGFDTNLVSDYARLAADNSVIFVAGNKVVIEQSTQTSPEKEVQRTKSQSYFAYHQTAITAIGLNKSKDLVATSDTSGVIFVWDFSTRAVVSRLQVSQRENASVLKFANESPTLLCVNNDKFFTLDVFDYLNEKLVTSLRLYEGPIQSISFSTDEDFITVTSENVRFWKFRGANLTSSTSSLKDLKQLINSNQDGEKNHYQDTETEEEPELLTCGIFAFSSNLCLTGTSKGRIFLWKDKTIGQVVQSSVTTTTRPLTRMVCHKNILYVCAADGCVSVWVDKGGMVDRAKVVKDIVSKQFPKFSISSLDIGSDNTALFMMVGTDIGRLFINYQALDSDSKSRQQSRSMLPTIKQLESPKDVTQSHTGKGILAVAVHQLLPRLATAGDDGDLVIWNAERKIKENVFRESDDRAKPFTALDWSQDGEYIVAVSSSGVIYVLDPMLEQVRKSDALSKQASTSKFLAVKISASPYTIAVAVSKDTFSEICIFEFNPKNKDIVVKERIDTKVGSACRFMDWSLDGQYLACTLDNRERVFVDVKNAGLTSYASVKKVDWLTWTQPVGPPVTGVRVDDEDLKFSPVCRSFKYHPKVADFESEYQSKPVRLFVVAGDREGHVNLYRYPSVAAGSDCKSYRALSASITDVKFFARDQYVVAISDMSNCVAVYETDFKDDKKVVDNVELILLQSDANDQPVKNVEVLPKVSNPKRELSERGEGLRRDIEHRQRQGAKRVEEPWMTNFFYPTNYYKPAVFSHLAPKVEVRPAYVFGFRSKDVRDNLKYINKNEVVYATAAIVVIHNTKNKAQRFFVEHQADVSCFAVRNLDGLVASGDLGSPPSICVWSAESLACIKKFKVDAVNGFLKIRFSPSGPYLATVGLDARSTIAVFNFETGFQVCSVPGDGATHRIFDLQWLSKTELVTVGVNHVKFWKLGSQGLKDTRGCLDPKNGAQRMICCEVNKRDLVVGTTKGEILVWRRVQRYTDYPQLFSLGSDYQGNGNSVEMICFSDQQ